MADKKISQLTALAAANLAPSTDVLAIVDTSATETKKIVAQDLINGVLNVASAVGIGTASPAVKLHVQGSAGQIMRVTDGTTGASIYSGGGLFGFNNQTGEDGMFGSTASHFLYFATNGGEKMRLDSSGNLGLGVTPNVWLSSFRAIQLGQGSSLWGAATGNNAGFDSNVYVNTSGGSIYVGSTFATRYQQSDGTHKWFIAPSGTAGDAISFTQAMTLDADGDLAIGATSTSDRLHVERNWNGSTWVRTVNTNSGSGAAAGMLFQNNTGDLGAISLLSSANSPADSLFLRSLSTNPLVFGTNNTERGRFTAGGNLLVGTTTDTAARITVTAAAAQNAMSVEVPTVDYFGATFHNKATSGDNVFLAFGTEASFTTRGSITYNRAGGLVAYNTTSDYRAKEVYGLLDDSGETIDALKVYRGKMHGATMERPMLIAHEAQEVAPYAVSGEKDAVNDDGTPKFQQMDTSSLVPLLIAEIQSLRSRVSALEAQ